MHQKNRENKQTFVKKALLALFFLIFWASGRSEKFPKDPVTLGNSWKIDFRGGAGFLLSPVPDQYLFRINQVNVPMGVPGPAGIFGLRKSFSPHFEMGYQLEYIRARGDVDEPSGLYRVTTQAINNSFVLLYNFRTRTEAQNRFNYQVYYKAGAIALKNDPLLKKADGSYETPTFATRQSFLGNAAVLSGLGIGVTHPLSGNLRIMATVELNRSSDTPAELYKLWNIFVNSRHSVNSFILTNVGVNYEFGFENPEKAKIRRASHKAAWKPKKEKKHLSRNTGASKNYSIWYKRGKRK